MSNLKRLGKLRCVLPGFLVVIPLMSACQTERVSPPGTEDPLVQVRRVRDRFFKESPQSPIPERDRGQFQGLDYYPIDPALRFQLKLVRYPIPVRVRLETNTGEIRDGLRYGYFEFRAEGQVCRLQAYRMEDSADSGKPYLFIPFRDATSGKETYGAGRYLDLPENTSGTYNLDFNRAYNPSCAYGDGYSCPLPPQENRLEVAIRAGEKNYRHTPGL